MIDLNESDLRPVRHLIFLAGDQLNEKFLEACGFNFKLDAVVIIESIDESLRQRQHRTKISYFFITMRRFAESLKTKNVRVIYIRLSHLPLKVILHEIAKTIHHQKIIFFRPGEHEFSKIIQSALHGMRYEQLENPMFICSVDEFKEWSKAKKSLRMEYFYRYMRKKTGILVGEDGTPEGNQWNFDEFNRRPYRGTPPSPQIQKFELKTCEIELIDEINKLFPDSFGKNQPQLYPLDYDQAMIRWNAFLEYGLEHFGPYQDAMAIGEPFLFHSLISAPLNLGILDPMDLLLDVEKAYIEGRVELASAEGFIRQILGWREYVRGIYWIKMPEYKEMNYLETNRPIPDFFWSANSGMRCFDQAIEQTREYAYAHHIQRLMIVGNFALIAGLAVKEVCDWYLEVFIDAVEWVELPNTLGMALHGDEGYLGSKPYAASANYISKMSNYCKDCRFDKKTKFEKDSCPFNFLYWDFFIRHKDKFARNQRLAMVYKNLHKLSQDEIILIQQKASQFLNSLNQ